MPILECDIQMHRGRPRARMYARCTVYFSSRRVPSRLVSSRLVRHSLSLSLPPSLPPPSFSSFLSPTFSIPPPPIIVSLLRVQQRRASNAAARTTCVTACHMTRSCTFTRSGGRPCPPATYQNRGPTVERSSGCGSTSGLSLSLSSWRTQVRAKRQHRRDFPGRLAPTQTSARIYLSTMSRARRRERQMYRTETRCLMREREREREKEGGGWDGNTGGGESKGTRYAKTLGLTKSVDEARRRGRGEGGGL